MTKEEKQDLLETASRTLAKMAERQEKASVQARHIVETFANVYIQQEEYNKRTRQPLF